ncbi:MAG: hypothetical protein GF311_00945 [Candidatus Lokiarchaeota archaeon]|nr:hypothetical protein [Candidatus Lokiarchaeota archaeon]
MKCEYCGKQIDHIPFQCEYCGRYYCDDHRLHENHYCTYALKKLEEENSARVFSKIKAFFKHLF